MVTTRRGQRARSRCCAPRLRLRGKHEDQHPARSPLLPPSARPPCTCFASGEFVAPPQGGEPLLLPPLRTARKTSGSGSPQPIIDGPSRSVRTFPGGLSGLGNRRCPTKLGEENLVKPVPHAHLGPLGKAAPARHARAEAELFGCTGLRAGCRRRISPTGAKGGLRRDESLFTG